MPITALTDAERSQWTAAVQTLVEGVPPIFRLDALQVRGWVCVAIEDELQDEAAFRLATACADEGFVSGWSLEVPWTPGNWTPGAHRFALSAAGFVALSKEAYIGSCYLLADDRGGFAVTSDGDLYWMLAGPRMFVEAAIGRSIEAELQAFGRNADAYGGPATKVGQTLHAAQSVAIASCGAQSGSGP